MAFKEVVVAKKSDLKDGETKSISVDEAEILLVRVGGNFYALGAHCTHYGAPLSEGLLSGDRIVCPWHHACFHVHSGNLLEPPALDGLPTFETWIDGENVVVKLPEKIPFSKPPRMARYEAESDNRTFIILGAGAAGNMAAQTLREDGFKGRILMITRENRTPYDRPNLSKDYLQGAAEPEWMPLRTPEFYRKYDIELMLQTKILNVDIPSQTLKIGDGSSLVGDELLIVTGARARTPDIPGAHLNNIYTLRSYDDCDRIIEASKNAKNAVIIGSGFIGMETAFSLTGRGLPVTVISRDSLPFEHLLGREIGEMFRRLHEERGVRFEMNAAVTEFQGNSSVNAVTLDTGDTVEAGLVIVGIGVEPVTDFLQGIELEADGSIKVDRYFRAADHVFAAGDVASFPDWHTGQAIRIEHWRTAEQQGRVAAHNMAGKNMAYRSVPFFWTDQVGLHFRYVGHAPRWEEIIIHGDVSAQDFIAYYIKNNQVWAAAGNNHDREMDAVSELIRQNKMPTPTELQNEQLNLLSYLE